MKKYLQIPIKNTMKKVRIALTFTRESISKSNDANSLTNDGHFEAALMKRSVVIQTQTEKGR